MCHVTFQIKGFVITYKDYKYIFFNFRANSFRSTVLLSSNSPFEIITIFKDVFSKWIYDVIKFSLLLLSLVCSLVSAVPHFKTHFRLSLYNTQYQTLFLASTAIICRDLNLKILKLSFSNYQSISFFNDNYQRHFLNCTLVLPTFLQVHLVSPAGYAYAIPSLHVQSLGNILPVTSFFTAEWCAVQEALVSIHFLNPGSFYIVSDSQTSI